jgi:hypothetical protein
MASWGTCTLLKNPVDEVLAYVAHHQELGAEKVFLFFDDPRDPAADVLETAAGVVVTRCDEAFWNGLAGKRPFRHTERQRQVLRKTYLTCGLDWLLHIDADEFLLCDMSVDELLDDVPAHLATVKARPFEAMSGDLPKGDRIYRAVHFRTQITDPALIQQLFGPFAPALHRGMVSHRLGKSFFRTGVPNLLADIHFARIGETTTEAQEFHPALRHLHFHGDDAEHWVSTAHYKARVGGVRFNEPYAKTLLALDEAGLRRFHRRVHSCDPAVVAMLTEKGLMLSIDLELEAKVARLRQSLPNPIAKAEPATRKWFFGALLGRGRQAA